MHFFHFHIDHWILDCAFGCCFCVDYFSTYLKLNWLHKLHWLVRDNLRFPSTCIYSYHCSINISTMIIILYLIVQISIGNWLNGSGIDVNIIKLNALLWVSYGLWTYQSFLRVFFTQPDSNLLFCNTIYLHNYRKHFYVFSCCTNSPQLGFCWGKHWIKVPYWDYCFKRRHRAHVVENTM